VLILLALWLQSVREKAFNDLRRETGFLFRATLTSMKDSVLLRNIEPVNVDSLGAPGSPPLLTEGLMRSAEEKDGRTKCSSRIQIIVQSPGDSLKKTSIQNDCAGVRITGENKPGLHRLLLSDVADSLILTRYRPVQDALDEAGFDARFTISILNAPPGELYDRITTARLAESPVQPPLSCRDQNLSIRTIWPG